MTGYKIGRVTVTYEDGPLPTPCHIWQGCTNSRGYGCRTVDSTRVLAHRAAWESENGPLAEGEQIHHVCEQRRCINPDHLRATTALAHNRAHVDHPLAEDILGHLADGRTWRASEIAREVGRPPDVVGVTLRRCINAGELEKVALGHYRLWGAA